MPEFNSDDDVAATRIRHADGTIVTGPVVAAASVVHAALNHLNPAALNPDQATWLVGMLNLSAAP